MTNKRAKLSRELATITTAFPNPHERTRSVRIPAHYS